MSAERGMFARRRFVLSAHSAASRFARRGAGARRIGGAWHPVAVRWRRQRARPAQRHAAGLSATVNATWLTQVQLHLNVRSREGSIRRGRPSAHTAVRVAGGRHPIVERHLHVGRPAATLARMPQTVSAPGALHVQAAVADRPIVAQPAAVPRTAFHSAPALMPSIERRPRLRSLVRYRSGRRAREANDERVRSAPRRQPDDLRASAHPSRAAVRFHTSTRSPADDVASRVLLRQAEIIWRSARRSARPSVEGSVQDAAAPLSQRMVAEKNTGLDMAMPVPSPAATTATMEVTKLAPALMDRLADDVIRRVERRVRIDRERRGL